VTLAHSIPSREMTSGNAPTHASHRSSSRSGRLAPGRSEDPPGAVVRPLLHCTGLVPLGGLLVQGARVIQQASILLLVHVDGFRGKGRRLRWQQPRH
jgi:hypothetical protein